MTTDALLLEARPAAAPVRTRPPLTSHMILIALSILSIFPIYWMVISSFKPVNEIFTPSLFPTAPTLENYVRVFDTLPMNVLMANTILVAVMQTGFQLITSILAAYALARWKFPGSGVIYTLFALTWLVPFQATMIPNYVLLTQLNLRNTALGIIIPNIGSAFAILLLAQSFRSFPRELIESAQLDGATSWGILWRIIFPNLRPVVASLGILLFINSWNEYFWPLLVSSRMDSSTLQIGLQMFMAGEVSLWGPVMAAATLTSLPIFLLYVVLQRQIIDSFVKSGLR
ncbi:MAG: carbohydrate ABC transporter permease [Chloroflexota bacterium]|nr:carbohydrate ABC transporter permease [Chloroflexota bacterium]